MANEDPAIELEPQQGWGTVASLLWPLVPLGGNRGPRGWALKKIKFSRLFYAKLIATRAGIKGELGFDDENPVPRLYWLLVVVRILMVLAPQSGCVHPDEYFQTLEPVAGSLLDIEWHRTWEFNYSFPIRGIAAPYLSVGIPLKILKDVHLLLRQYSEFSLITPYLLLIVPRLFYCLLSFVNDYSLFKICQNYGMRSNRKMIVLATSQVTLIYSLRTFSNSLEIVLLSVLLFIVSDCMRTSGYIIQHQKLINKKYEQATEPAERARYHKLRILLPNNSLSQCIQIATITVLGVFNRPTFIAYAFPSVFLWLLRGMGTGYTRFTDFHQRSFVFLLSCLPTLFLVILFDSGYYGYLAMSDIEQREVGIDNFVVTPLNFIRYNIFQDNLAEHGLHSRWSYVLLHIPMLFSILGLATTFYFIQITYYLIRGNFRYLPRIQSLTGLLLMTIFFPVLILSMFPHQEPRFLIPLQLPIVILFTKMIQHVKSDGKWTKRGRTILFVILCVQNILITVFFAFIHQGGIIPMVSHFQKEIANKPKFTNIHIVTSHIYDMPQSLLLMRDTSRIRVNSVTSQNYKLSKQVFIHELRSKNIRDVVKQIKVLWDVSESNLKNKKQMFRMYMAMPNSLRFKLQYEWSNQNMTSLSLKEEASFFPHLSTEAMPYYPPENDPICISDYQHEPDVTWDVKLTKYGQIMCYFKQYSLSIYRIDKAYNFAY